MNAHIIEEKRVSLVASIKKHCEDIRPLNTAGIAIPMTLTLGNRIHALTYRCATEPAHLTHYRFVGEYFWTAMQMSPFPERKRGKSSSEADILACFLYRRQTSHNGLISGPHLKEVCVIIPALPFYDEDEVYTRVSLEAPLSESPDALAIIADFASKANAALQ